MNYVVVIERMGKKHWARARGLRSGADHLKMIGPELFSEPSCEIPERSMSILNMQQVNEVWFYVA